MLHMITINDVDVVNHVDFACNSLLTLFHGNYKDAAVNLKVF